MMDSTFTKFNRILKTQFLSMAKLFTLGYGHIIFHVGQYYSAYGTWKIIPSFLE